MSEPDTRAAEHLEEFYLYLRSPWRVIWVNFLAGVMRAIGALFGATLLFAGLLWLLARFVDFPLIGEYFQEWRTQILTYAEEARYGDDFARIEAQLEAIHKELAQARTASKPAAVDSAEN